MTPSLKQIKMLRLKITKRARGVEEEMDMLSMLGLLV